jgi:hypothetical protein
MGLWFFKLGRLCLSSSRDHGRCWICSAAAGMGPIWTKNGMTCWECYDRWGWIKETGLRIDWLGIGRQTRKNSRKDGLGQLLS